MRAGTLDRVIIVQRSSEAVGMTAPKSWATLGELRAELVNLAAVTSGAPYGTVETTGVMFRTHYVPGLTTADRIVFGGEVYNITAVTEIGRRVGLELKVERSR